jgi:serine/threonine-protein kinase
MAGGAATRVPGPYDPSVFCPTCQGEYPETWKVCPKDGAEMLKSPRIGKYVVSGPLGKGGMGTVYRAVNPDTKGEVALKVMHADVADSDSARSRFKREAAAVSKLTTSHVVKVFDFGADTDGTLYLVMELLDGHALREEIQSPPMMDVARAQFVMDGVLKGLSAAHKAGIIHRDLKPENIFLANTDDGEVPRILDFGIARIETPEGVVRSGAVTKPGTVMGTAAYMAPEQLQGLSSQVGTWSDVYAVGAMLYEMLAGETPVKANGGLAEVLLQIRRGGVTPLASLRSDLPPALCETIHRAMAADHKQRPQTGEELRGALAKVWGGAPSRSLPPVPTKSAAPVPATTNHVVATLDTMPAKPRALAAMANTLPADQPAPAPAPAAVTTTSNASKLWLVMVVLAVIAIVLVIVLTR